MSIAVLVIFPQVLFNSLYRDAETREAHVKYFGLWVETEVATAASLHFIIFITSSHRVMLEVLGFPSSKYLFSFINYGKPHDSKNSVHRPLQLITMADKISTMLWLSFSSCVLLVPEINSQVLKSMIHEWQDTEHTNTKIRHQSIITPK